MAPTRLAGTLVSSAAVLALASTAPAQVPFGPEFQVNTYTTGHQTFSDAAASADGTMMVVWQKRIAPSQLSVHGRVFDPSGSAVGTEFALSTYANNRQARPAVAADAAGRFVTSWSHYAGGALDVEVHARRFSNTGAPIGTVFAANSYTTGAQGYFTDVASDAAGNFVVVWTSEEQDGYESGVFAQRFDSTGAPSGTEFQVNTYTTYDQGDNGSGSNRAVSVARSAAGDFVVVWTSYGQDGDETSVHGQRFDAAGATVGAEFQANSYTTGQQGGYGGPDVFSTGIGSFVVVWESYYQDGAEWGIFGQRFDSSGPVGTEFLVNTYTSSVQGYGPRVAAAPGGDFTVVWSSGGQDGTPGTGIFAQRYDAAGAVSGTEFQVNTYTTGLQWFPAIASDWRGCETMAWTSGAPRLAFPCVVDTDCPKYPGEICKAGSCEPIGQQDGDEAGIFAQRYCDAPTLDHFKCYVAKDINQPRFAGQSGVDLADQFTDESVDVQKIRYLCNPVDKNGEGVGDADHHLCCHVMKAAALKPAPLVEVVTQFQSSRLYAKKGKLLCAPCTKTELGP